MVFAINIDHAEKVAAELRRHGVSVALVHSGIDGGERDRLIEEFSAGRCRCLVNVAILVEGVDSPGVDPLVMINPMLSPGGYCQMVGRGLGTFPGKENVLVLDFSGNIGTCGPIDRIDSVPKAETPGLGGAPMKQCEKCGGFRTRMKTPRRIFVDEAGAFSKILKFGFQAGRIPARNPAPGTNRKSLSGRRLRGIRAEAPASASEEHCRGSFPTHINPSLFHRIESIGFEGKPRSRQNRRVAAENQLDKGP
ncbi:MAG: hypothetical protein GY866_13455 [Proteobacteria bacterium]|nr:hypothetical protein [Pseudomonadota bacterium]